MDDYAARAAAVRERYNACFGCGLENPIGLQLDGFTRDGTGLSATFTPRAEYQGFAGVLHGGIMAALLDETMAWTAMMIAGSYVVTANLEIKYRRPAPADQAYTMRGSIDEQRGRRLLISATAESAATVLAEASGLFLATETVAG